MRDADHAATGSSASQLACVLPEDRARQRGQVTHGAGTPVRRSAWILILTSMAVVGFVEPCWSQGTVYQAAPGQFVSDCSVAVDQAINAWIKTIPDGTSGNPSIVKFVAGACYGLNGSILVGDPNVSDPTPSTRRHYLTFDGNGATFKAITLADGITVGGTFEPNQNRSNWTVGGGSNITFEHMTIIGFASPPTPPATWILYDISTILDPTTNSVSVDPTKIAKARDYSYEHGINFAGVQTGLVDDVNISWVLGNFITASSYGKEVADGHGGWSGTTPTTNLTIQNSSFSFSGLMGVGLTDIDGFVLRKSYIGHVGGAAVDLELNFNGEVGRNISILDNTFDTIYLSIFSNAGAGYPGAQGNVTISRNVQTVPLDASGNYNGGFPSCQPVIYVVSPLRTYNSGFTVTNNQFAVLGDVMYFVRVNNLTVSANTATWINQWCIPPFAAIRLCDSRSASVTSNTFTNDPKYLFTTPTPLVRQESLTAGVTTRNNTPSTRTVTPDCTN